MEGGRVLKKERIVRKSRVEEGRVRDEMGKGVGRMKKVEKK